MPRGLSHATSLRPPFSCPFPLNGFSGIYCTDEPQAAEPVKLFSDILIFFGAILLTIGTDLVVETAGQNMSSVGGLLGVLVSIIGVSMLTAGLLSHFRYLRENESRDVDLNGRR